MRWSSSSLPQVTRVSCFPALLLHLLLLLSSPQSCLPQPVTLSGYRFTAFSPTLIRLEYSPTQVFDDRFTQQVVSRASTTPLTLTPLNSTTAQLSTGALTILITHIPLAPFSSSNLLVQSGSLAWSPGTTPQRNLNGTWTTSLDCYTNDPMDCINQYENNGAEGPGWTYGMTDGLLTRDGWSVLDDTYSVRFIPPTPPYFTPWWSNTTLDAQDWYLNFYGTNLTRAMRDWVGVLGPPALPPKNSLGVWYSRYYPYTEEQLLEEVVGGFSSFSLPLSVLVSDMDWHTEPTDPNCSAWGQYDFNTTLYPSCASDPSCSGFLGKLHSSLPPDEGGNAMGHPLSLSLNLHSNVGIDKCALRYADFAAAVGVNPATNASIPCDFGSELWSSALYKVYLNALPLLAGEGGGMDFPWPDYNGCGQLQPPFVNTSSQPWARHYGAAQTFWATYVQASQAELGRGVRPLVLARHGGIGNHRIPFFFTGDTLQHEGTLDYQVKRTASAANVMVSVSHDVGGNHFQGDCQPAGVNLTGPCAGSSDPANATSSELFLRWVQFGVFSSVLRTHCDHCLRLPWLYTYHSAELFDALRLREALSPTLYTAHRDSIDSGIVPVHPTYYHFPTLEPAYQFEHQYMFTSHILVAPITTISSGGSGNPPISPSVWIPPGLWVAWDGSRSVTGPVVDSTQAYTAAQIPAFVPHFTLLPLKGGAFTGSPRTATGFPTPDLQWTLWLGDSSGSDITTSGSGEVYEDDGVSLDWRYGVGNSARTQAQASVSGNGTRLDFSMAPVEGSFPGMGVERGVSLQVRGGVGWGGRVVGVFINGQPLPGPTPPPPSGSGGGVGWWVQQVGDEGTGLLLPLLSLNVHAGSIRVAEGVQVSVSLKAPEWVN